MGSLAAPVKFVSLPKTGLALTTVAIICLFCLVIDEGPAPEQTEVRDPAGGAAGCDPAYPDLYIPPPPLGLDCSYVYDQGFRHITVLPPDPHNLDGNHDGVACEGG
jgi:hypothetical protein